MKNEIIDAKTALIDAERAHEAALQEVDQALAAFDIEGSQAAAAKLAKAREKAATAAEFVGRAERLLRAAEAQAQADQRATLQSELGQLEQQLSAQAVQAVADPLREAEVDALLAVVSARAARLRAQYRLEDLASQAASVRAQLGMQARGVGGLALVSRQEVAELLVLACAGQGQIERREAETLAREVSR